MLKDGGGNRDAPYLTALQVQTITSTVLEHFFVMDRMELMVPQVAEKTGRAARYLHLHNHMVGENIQASDDWSLACEKLVSAIHDIEALELCIEWKVKKDAEDAELENLAIKLFNLSNPLSDWKTLSISDREKWINIALHAKSLLS
jgi:hypothetical protein